MVNLDLPYKESYRPEIDGLRAISVLSVILFHAGFQTFQGGFVGVDIFFVISGYLITKNIDQRMESNTFSISDFYFRRIKRILPALTFVCMCSGIVAWFTLMPKDLEEFADSLKSVATISSNVFFSNNSGYFNSLTKLKPLLHTWSLAVEEQFYLIFPLYLILIRRLKKDLLLPITILITFISLALNQHPYFKEDISSFFLLPTRCWEILIGACIALYASSHLKRDMKPLTSFLIELLAAVMILGSILFLNKYHTSQVLFYLFPTVGTCLILLYTHERTILGKILVSRPLVTIGLFSYSAYLLHQPIFAFARRELLDHFQTYALSFVLLTLLLAYPCWKFIEMPFRRIHQKKLVFTFGVLSTVSMLTMGYVLKKESFDLSRFPERKRAVILSAVTYARDGVKRFDRSGCFIGFHQSINDLITHKCISRFDKTVVLFGDSHAAHHLDGIKEIFKNSDLKVQEWTATACRSIDFPANTQRCRDFINHFTSEIVNNLSSTSTVLISSHWLNTYNKFGEKQFHESVIELLNKLKKTKSKIVIIGQSPTFRVDPFVYLLQEERYENTEELMKPNINSHVNKILERYANEYGHEFVNPSASICSSLQSNTPTCFIKIKREYLFFDSNHLSGEGSLIVWKNFKGFLLEVTTALEDLK
jgi:peptidoglycan/LPS O-acetylase OafA/YrhL